MTGWPGAARSNVIAVGAAFGLPMDGGEPVTPIGEMYATQSHAAFLAPTDDQRYATSYVGTGTLAREFGSHAMHWRVGKT